MENKWKEAKIYKIVCNVSGEEYYGSTIKVLEERLRLHTIDKHCVSRYIIERGDYNIELIKHYPCNNLKELEEEESKYIRKNKCINVVIPNRTKKEWYEDNKEKINKQKREYNKIKIKCECGKIVRRDSIHKHRKSQKHLKFISTI
tara:strand:+ start:118 stop:555 length:438 start_codon:yes stop_codon:yes gene_type:complete